MLTRQEVKEKILRMFEAYNTGDLRTIDKITDEVFTADYVWHFPGVTDLPPGPAGMKQVSRGILADNPVFMIRLDDLIMEGDKIALRCTMQRSDPVTGKTQQGMVLTIRRLAESQYAEDWELISPWEDKE